MTNRINTLQYPWILVLISSQDEGDVFYSQFSLKMKPLYTILRVKSKQQRYDGDIFHLQN